MKQVSTLGLISLTQSPHCTDNRYNQLACPLHGWFQYSFLHLEQRADTAEPWLTLHRKKNTHAHMLLLGKQNLTSAKRSQSFGVIGHMDFSDGIRCQEVPF